MSGTLVPRRLTPAVANRSAVGFCLAPAGAVIRAGLIDSRRTIVQELEFGTSPASWIKSLLACETESKLNRHPAPLSARQPIG